MTEFRKIQPKEYYQNFINEKVRPDGRELLAFRPCVVNTGSVSTANGSAVGKLGNTTVVCGIKAELSNPKREEPNRGFIVPNVELSPACHSMFKPGPPSEQAQIASQCVMNIINSSGCIKPEDLCIQPEKLVWALYCDVICLEYDGNILDASVMALSAALKNTTLPEVKIDAETEAITVDEKVRNPLVIHNTPVSLTFALFDSKTIVADPTVEEEGLVLSNISIVYVEDKMCYYYKPGGSPITDQQLFECMNTGAKRKDTIQRLISEAASTVER